MKQAADDPADVQSIKLCCQPLQKSLPFRAKKALHMGDNMSSLFLHQMSMLTYNIDPQTHLPPSHVRSIERSLLEAYDIQDDSASASASVSLLFTMGRRRRFIIGVGCVCGVLQMCVPFKREKRKQKDSKKPPSLYPYHPSGLSLSVFLSNSHWVGR